MSCYHLLLCLVTVVIANGTSTKSINDCKIELKFDYGDQPRVFCYRVCDISEDNNGFFKSESVPRRIYYRSEEIDRAFNKVVELNIKEDGSVECSLINSSTKLDSLEPNDSHDHEVVIFHDSPILEENEPLVPESLKRLSANQCGDDGYEYFEDIDWCVKLSSGTQRWNKVELACASEGGTFAIVDTKEKDDAVRELLQRRNVMDAWIGLSDAKEEGIFEWIDGTPLSYTSWSVGQPDEAIEEEDCVHYFRPFGYMWSVYYCNSFFLYLCEKKKTYPITKILPATNAGVPACPRGWLKSAVSDTCYHIRKEANSFERSLAYCNEKGGSLASIHNKAEMQFIKDMLKETNINKVWIGLTDASLEDDFAWIDGSPLSFVRWSSDQPDNGEGNENCVSVDRSHNFLWNDVPCTEFIQPLCMRKSEILPLYIKGCSSGCVIVQTLAEFNEQGEQRCPWRNTGALVCVPRPNKAGYTNYKPLIVIVMVCCIVSTLFVFYAFRCFDDYQKEKKEKTLERSVKEYGQYDGRGSTTDIGSCK